MVEIETAGDRIRDVALSQIGGDGVFTKEIQRALLAGVVDVAVHSLKDLPTTFVAGLTLGAVPARGPSGDVFVSHKHKHFDELPQGAVVGTSSLRRRSQALHRRPDLTLVNLRGNVETRLRKLDEQNFDAIILAEAGLRRLGLESAITEILDPQWMLPAVGQGGAGPGVPDGGRGHAWLARSPEPSPDARRRYWPSARCCVVWAAAASCRLARVPASRVIACCYAGWCCHRMERNGSRVR